MHKEEGSCIYHSHSIARIAPLVSLFIPFLGLMISTPALLTGVRFNTSSNYDTKDH